MGISTRCLRRFGGSLLLGAPEFGAILAARCDAQRLSDSFMEQVVQGNQVY